MKRQRHVYIKQIAFPAFYILWAFLLVLWMIYLVRSH